MNRLLSIFTVALATTTFVVQPVGAQADRAPLDANKMLVRDLYAKVINGAESSAIDQLLSPDYAHNAGVPAGREEYGQFIAAFRKAVPDYAVTIQGLFAEGDWVAVRAAGFGTQKGELNGVPATGKAFAVNIADLFRIKNGQIVEHQGIFDTLSLLEQLGVIKAPQLSPIPTAQATASAAPTAFVTDISQATLENNKSIVQKLQTAFYSGDDATIDQLVAVDYVYHGLGGQGLEGLKKAFAGYRAALPDLHIEVVTTLAERDMVTIYTTYAGTQHGALLGIPATGKPVITHTVDFYRLKDGKVLEHWDVVDFFSVLQQLGVIPAAK